MRTETKDWTAIDVIETAADMILEDDLEMNTGYFAFVNGQMSRRDSDVRTLDPDALECLNGMVHALNNLAAFQTDESVLADLNAKIAAAETDDEVYDLTDYVTSLADK